MKVLFAVDGSDSSLEAVAEVSPLLDAARDNVAIYCSPPSLRGAPHTSEELLARARQGLVDAVFEEARRRLPEPLRVAVETIVGTEDPRQGIISASESWGAELLVVGARGLGSFERLLVGSVSRSVVHDSKVPVWVARTSADRSTNRPRRILLACEDPPEGCPPQKVVAGLSWPAGSSCRAVTIVPSLLAGNVPDWLQKQARSPEVEEMAAAWAREHAAQLQITRSELEKFCQAMSAGVTCQAEVIEGEPTGALLSIMAREHVDVAIVGHRRRNWLTSRLLGSTSGAVLNHAKCSVVIVPFQ